MTPLTVPSEDYLERIYELLGERGYARVTDIAERLQVKPASVTRMLQKLEGAGYLNRVAYRGFSLTEKGKTVGRKIKKRHQVLAAFLKKLGVPTRVIKHDIEGLEHHLSDQTLKKLELFITS